MTGPGPAPAEVAPGTVPLKVVESQMYAASERAPQQVGEALGALPTLEEAAGDTLARYRQAVENGGTRTNWREVITTVARPGATETISPAQMQATREAMDLSGRVETALTAEATRVRDGSAAVIGEVQDFLTYMDIQSQVTVDRNLNTILGNDPGEVARHQATRDNVLHRIMRMEIVQQTMPELNQIADYNTQMNVLEGLLATDPGLRENVRVAMRDAAKKIEANAKPSPEVTAARAARDEVAGRVAPVATEVAGALGINDVDRVKAAVGNDRQALETAIVEAYLDDRSVPTPVKNALMNINRLDQNIERLSIEAYQAGLDHRDADNARLQAERQTLIEQRNGFRDLLTDDDRGVYDAVAKAVRGERVFNADRPETVTKGTLDAQMNNMVTLGAEVNTANRNLTAAEQADAAKKLEKAKKILDEELGTLMTESVRKTLLTNYDKAVEKKAQAMRLQAEDLVKENKNVEAQAKSNLAKAMRDGLIETKYDKKTRKVERVVKRDKIGERVKYLIARSRDPSDEGLKRLMLRDAMGDTITLADGTTKSWDEVDLNIELPDAQKKILADLYQKDGAAYKKALRDAYFMARGPLKDSTFGLWAKEKIGWEGSPRHLELSKQDLADWMAYDEKGLMETIKNIPNADKALAKLENAGVELKSKWGILVLLGMLGAGAGTIVAGPLGGLAGAAGVARLGHAAGAGGSRVEVGAAA